MGIIRIFYLNIQAFPYHVVGGMVITYIMLKTNNILIPMLYHFIYNLYAILPNFISPDIFYAIYGLNIYFLIPISIIVSIVFFLLGRHLLKIKEDIDERIISDTMRLSTE